MDTSANPTKVHLIRHGESTHNEFAEHTRGVDPYYWDAELSATGVQQTHVLSQNIQARTLVPDVIIVSPLTRAIKTAKNGFSHLPEIKYIVHPMLSEKIDNACDVGKPASVLKGEWANDAYVDFSLLDKEIWFPAPEHITAENYREQFTQLRWGESRESLQSRIDYVKEWISKQGYKEVAVVGHSAYFKLWLKADSKMPNCHIETTSL